MLSAKIEKALNEQIQVEANAAFQYFAYASWCNQKKLHGAYSFFMRQANEELEHMNKIFHYVNEVGGFAISPKLNQPKISFDSIKEIIEASLKNEQNTTAAIHKLTELCLNEKDYATHNFLQFFVTEQQEEELLFRTILDKIELIGTDGIGLYYIDKEIATISQEVEENEG